MKQEFEATFFKKEGRIYGFAYSPGGMVHGEGKTLSQARKSLKESLAKALDERKSNLIRGKDHLTETITI